MSDTCEHHRLEKPQFRDGFSSIQRYELYLDQISKRIEGLCPTGTLFSVSNIGFGPDGGGIPAVRIQGEYCQRIRNVFGSQVMVSPLTNLEYELEQKKTVEQQPTGEVVMAA